MNLLVTGGCGFIGSNAINYLASAHPDWRIINIDKLDYCASESNVTVTDNYTFILGDICDPKLMTHTLNHYSIDAVIHFAAQSHVDNSFGNSIQFTKDNVLGTHTLLECCKVYGKLKRFLHISTDEVYGEVDMEHDGCCEKSLLNPTNPYAATKAAAEFLCKSYYTSFGLPIVMTRGNNVYGPNQYPEKLIPKFVKHIVDGEKCTVHGKGITRRNFIHVLDVAKAVDVIFNKGSLNEIYNIGTDNEYSVMDIFYMICDALKPGESRDDFAEYVEDRAFNDFRYAINSDKLKALGWSETVNFKEGLAETMQHYVDKFSSVRSNTQDAESGQ